MSDYQKTSQNASPALWFNQAVQHRGILFIVLILAALLAFETFNFSTTQYSLMDLLGGMNFAGIKWATILAIAFCGIDFAGIARLFTAEQGRKEPTEVWYLFGAWFLAATMNAILTWWGISIDIQSHTMQSASVIDSNLLINVVPVIVALMVWLIRIMIIGSLSYAGDRINLAPERQSSYYPTQTRTLSSAPVSERRSIPVPQSTTPVRTPVQMSPKNVPEVVRPSASFSPANGDRESRENLEEIIASRPEPVYQSLTSSHKPPSIQPRQF
jgi:hypothetical protein